MFERSLDIGYLNSVSIFIKSNITFISCLKWTFLEKDNCTEIFFDIDFEIENKFLNIVMSKSFQYGLDKIADSFQKRANDLFKDK